MNETFALCTFALTALIVWMLLPDDEDPGE